MRKVFIYLACLFFIFCDKKEDSNFELEIISRELLMKPNQSTKNILRYKLTNKSDKTYLFNQFLQSKIFSKMNLNYLALKNSCFVVTDSKKDTVGVRYAIRNYTPEYQEFIDNKLNPTRELGYNINENVIYANLHFTIHPNETLYFEELVYLPSDKEYSLCYFDSIKENSFGSIFMFSDTTKINEVISRPTMENIKENNYSLFHGIIKSKNKIPIKIIK